MEHLQENKSTFNNLRNDGSSGLEEKDQTKNEDFQLNERVQQEKNNLNEEEFIDDNKMNENPSQPDQEEQNQDQYEKSLQQEDNIQEHDGSTEDLKEIPRHESDNESLDIEENNFFYPDESESEKETEVEPENSHPVEVISGKDSTPSDEVITSPELIAASAKTSDSSSSSSDESFAEPKHDTDNLHQNHITPKSSSSSSDENDEKEDQQEPEQVERKISEKPNSRTNQLHGHNENDSTPEEKNVPESYAYQPSVAPAQTSEPTLAESLKQALEERDKDESSEIDNSFLRARSANDFKDNAPPALPPKTSVPPALPPKSKNFHSNNDIPVFYVRDKTASLGRGMWSDDDDGTLPEAHRKKPLHPTPDRVIDFRNTAPRQNKKSHARDDKQERRHRDRSNRVIDIPRKPAEDINDIFKRQAMVSLHSSASTNQIEWRDPYDTVHDDDEEDLSRLIHQANNLNMNQSQSNKNMVDVVYPSFQWTNPAPQAASLTPNFPDAFSRIAPSPKNLDSNAQRNYDEEGRDFLSQGQNNHYSKSMPRKYKPIKNNTAYTFRDPLDGDDEISLVDSDFHYSKPDDQQHKSLVDHHSYLCEVYPTDYTEFESDSEIEDKARSALRKSGDFDVAPYDTVQDTDVENQDKENQLNPIVNEDYQICTSLKTNRNTFPRTFPNKPKTKERSSMNVMAVALTDPSTNIIQPSSFKKNSLALRRNKSIPVIKSDSGAVSLFGQTPNIVVTRDRRASSGGPLSTINGPQSLPVVKKSKHKKDNTEAPKVHVSLVSNSQPENDIKIPSNSGNLQINLLPSDDPNIINLNISTKQETGFVKQPDPVPTSNPDPSPLAFQPVLPITTVTRRIDSPTPKVLEETTDKDRLEHRVVEIAPVVIQSAPVNPEPTHVIFTEVTEAAPKEVTVFSTETPQTTSVSMNETTQPMPGQRQIVPVEVYPISTYERKTPSAPPVQEVQLVQQTISTQQTKAYEQKGGQPSEPAVIEIKYPSFDENYRSLPTEPPGNGSGIRNRGDSGIDVTNYKKSRRRRHSSSDDSDYDPKRSSSKRKLKDYADMSSDPNLQEEYMAWYKRTYLKPNCCYLFLKHFIFALNLIFGLVGVGLIGLGVWGFADLYYYGLTNPMVLLRDPVFPIFVTGVVMTLTCFEGAVGFFRDNICMIKFFGWCLVLLCLVFIGGGVAFWILRISQVTPFVINNFLTMIKNYNTTSRKVAAFTLNQMQSNLDCCGINSYSDWNVLDEFPCHDSVCVVPSSCCSPGHNVCSRNEAEGPRTLDACKDAMTLWLKNNTAILVGAWILIICLFIINFISIHFMIREILYLRLIEDRIHDINNYDNYQSDETSSDDLTSSDTDSEEERRRRRRRRRRKKRRERRARDNYHTNRSYR